MSVGIEWFVCIQGPLTDEYLDHLSEELSEEWKMLANRLKFSSASVQRIYTDHAHRISADATQRSARQMLSEWFRSSSKATDKVGIGFTSTTAIIKH